MDHKSGWPLLWRTSRKQVLRLIPIRKHKHAVLKRRDLFSSVPEYAGGLKKKKRPTHQGPTSEILICQLWVGAWTCIFSKNSTVVFDIQPRYALKTNEFESDSLVAFILPLTGCVTLSMGKLFTISVLIIVCMVIVANVWMQPFARHDKRHCTSIMYDPHKVNHVPDTERSGNTHKVTGPVLLGTSQFAPRFVWVC